jgi:flagellar hook-length control protein FliK
MTSVARSAVAGHAGHGFARPLAKNETPGEGFDALMASLAGGALAQAPVDPANGGNDGEDGRDAHPRSDAGNGADAALLATLSAQNGAGAAHALSAPNAPLASASDDAMHAATLVATAPSSSPEAAMLHHDTTTAVGAKRNVVAVDAAETADSSMDSAFASDARVDAATIAALRRATTDVRAPAQRADETVSTTNARARTESRDATRSASIDSSNDARAMLRVPPSDDVRAAMAGLFEKRDARPAISPSRIAIDLARSRQQALAATTPTAVDAANVVPTNDPMTFSTLIAMKKADAMLTDRADARDAIDSVMTPSASWNTSTLATASNAVASGAIHPASPSFDPAAWSAALARQVAAAAAAEAREASVTFEPKGLGPIEVRVRVDAARVDVRFAIEHPVTVNLVREALPDLEKLLAQSGMTLGDANVAQQQASGGGRQAFAASTSTSSRERDDDATLATSVEVRPRIRAGLLDDFV